MRKLDVRIFHDQMTERKVIDFLQALACFAEGWIVKWKIWNGDESVLSRFALF